MVQIIMEESRFSRFFLSDSRSAIFWLIVRSYVGWQWLHAGWVKIVNPMWVGADAGKPIIGFVNNALLKTGGEHPDVQGWYAFFLENIVLPFPSVWSHVVAWGELFVGIALIAGILTGIAAFFGLFMNLNYLLAGTVSINPVLFTLSIGLILAWRVSGYLGGDRYILPILHSYLRPKPEEKASS